MIDKDKRTRLHQYCEMNRNYPKTAPVYICRNCKAVFGHHVTWCPNCPGRCERMEFKSYGELFDQTGEAYEWGETRLWEEYRNLCQSKFDAERIKGIKEPCVVVFWVSEYSKDAFDKLVAEYGYKEYQQGDPVDSGKRMETGKIIYEYKFVFDSWINAHHMVYRRIVGPAERGGSNKVYIFDSYRKRMREV